jgi:Mycothiol maleylpyruvate isomerase N-terminal domain.
MKPPSRAGAWAAAVREHEVVLRDYVQRLHAVPDERWSAPRAEGKWSAAQEALHVAMAYEIGIAACGGSAGMRPVSPPVVAWLSRTLLLPVMLRLRFFPPNAPAPRELRPNGRDAVAFPRDDLIARLLASADRATSALREADARRPPIHVMHAYFGPLRPLAAFRLLTAHTRHHARIGMARLRTVADASAPARKGMHGTGGTD